MALIQCPECGKQVSDRAGTCPNCAFPLNSLRTDGTVSIKIANGLDNPVYIHDMSSMKVLWTGKAGQIAKFEIAKPIDIGIRWGIAKKPLPNTITRVEADRKYELFWRQGIFAKSLCVNEVDSFNSTISSAY